MAKEPSRGMLTAGAVGAFLIAGAYAVFLIIVFGAMGSISSGDPSFTMIRAFGGLGFLAGLVYVGGIPCLMIGFYGMGRIYKGLYATAGTLTAIYFGLIVVTLGLGPTMAPELADMRGATLEIVGWVLFIFILATYTVYGLALLRGHGGSAAARAGGIMFLICVAIIVAFRIWGSAMMAGDVPTSMDGAETALALAQWLAIAFLGLLALGHLATGLAMLHSRPTADAAAAF